MPSLPPIPIIDAASPCGQLIETVRQQALHISDAERQRVACLQQHFDDADQTVNPEWLASRVIAGVASRITGSVAAAPIGQHKYSSPYKFLLEKVWPKPMDERGQNACAWGNRHEPDAEESFAAYLACHCLDRPNFANTGFILRNFALEERGLMISTDPMLAMSPDGILTCELERPDGTIVTEKYLVEYKCPISFVRLNDNRLARGDMHLYPPQLCPTHTKETTAPLRPGMFVRTRFQGQDHIHRIVEILHDGNSLTIRHCETGEEQTILARKCRFFPPCEHPPSKIACPPYYYVQQQYGMELLNLSKSFFVTWSPGYIDLTIIERDEIYGAWIRAECKKFWFQYMLPFSCMKHTGLLQEDSLNLV